MARAHESTDPAAAGQVAAEAAEVYEQFFVAALFGAWPPRVLDRVGLAPGDHVLDVGCGTGVLARAAADRLAGDGSATGVDVNPGMLAVARRLGPEVTWQEAAAESLPFADGSFDRVVSQFALMFFVDRSAAVRELRRVLRPGGTVAVATWAAVDSSPGYLAMIELLERLFGAEVADALRAPFCIGTTEALAAELAPGFTDAAVAVVEGEACFPSIDAWVETDVRGWTLAEMIDDHQFEELQAAARADLGRFADADGRVRFAAPALVAIATR